MNLELDNKNFLQQLFFGQNINFNIRNGFGCQIFLNGDIYIGNFKNNNFDKKGIFIYNNIFLKGEFKNGILEKGEIFLNKKIKISGIFFEKKKKINFFSAEFFISDEIKIEINYENKKKIENIKLFFFENEINIFFQFSPKHIFPNKMTNRINYDENFFSFRGKNYKIKIFKNTLIEIEKINEFGKKNGETIIFKNIFEIEKIQYLDNKLKKKIVINKKKNFMKIFEEKKLIKFFDEKNGFQYEINNLGNFDFSLKFFPEIFFDFEGKIIEKNLIDFIIDNGLLELPNFNVKIYFFEISRQEEILKFFDILQSKIFFKEILNFEFLMKKILKNFEVLKFIEDFIDKDDYCVFFKDELKVYGLFKNEIENDGNLEKLGKNGKMKKIENLKKNKKLGNLKKNEKKFFLGPQKKDMILKIDLCSEKKNSEILEKKENQKKIFLKNDKKEILTDIISSESIENLEKKKILEEKKK